MTVIWDGVRSEDLKRVFRDERASEAAERVPDAVNKNKKNGENSPMSNNLFHST